MQSSSGSALPGASAIPQSPNVREKGPDWRPLQLCDEASWKLTAFFRVLMVLHIPAFNPFHMLDDQRLALRSRTKRTLHRFQRQKQSKCIISYPGEDDRVERQPGNNHRPSANGYGDGNDDGDGDVALFCINNEQGTEG